MKIACITVFCNELFRLEKWKQYYDEYKDDIFIHIIVNNGNSKDTPSLKESFPNSCVLESEGGNLLTAYNIGTQYALTNPEVDAIMQITNDVRFAKNAIRTLYHFLFSDPKLAVVGPVLLKKDSKIVESFGINYPCTTKDRGGKQTLPYKDKSIAEIPYENKRVSYVPAGTILQRRVAIEQMGPQDEVLQMYCDERDMAIRLCQLGYYEAVTKNAIAWHQHINRPGASGRSLLTSFYSSRNKIYLIHKHGNYFWALMESIKVIVYELLLVIFHYLKGESNKVVYDRVVITGTVYGFIKMMRKYPRWIIQM